MVFSHLGFHVNSGVLCICGLYIYIYIYIQLITYMISKLVSKWVRIHTYPYRYNHLYFRSGRALSIVHHRHIVHCTIFYCPYYPRLIVIFHKFVPLKILNFVFDLEIYYFIKSLNKSTLSLYHLKILGIFK
jgi:hypothetical protein